MNTAELIPFIRNIINEASVPGDSVASDFETVILDFIQAAATQLASMPAYQGSTSSLTETANVTFSARPDGMYYAVIKPGDDFLRPVSVILSGWVRPVFQFEPAVGTPFLRQYSSVSGIGSGPDSPVAFVTTDQQALIIAHAIKTPGDYALRYMAVPKIEADGTLPVPAQYREPLAYTAAALYLQSITEYNAAKAAFDVAGSIIQTINSKTNQQQ